MRELQTGRGPIVAWCPRYLRTVKTSSGATAVQIVHSSRRGSRDIEHLGSAHTAAEVELLKAAGRQKLAAGQGELDLGLQTATPGGPLPIISSVMGCLVDALAHAYDVLGFTAATGEDEAFFQLVAARIIEPVSKLDSLRVLEEAYESHAVALDRNELGAMLVAAGLGPPVEHALISLLALNGLRVSEATGADIEHLGLEREHRTLTINRKGGKVVTIPLAPRTARAIDLVIGSRTDGPVFLAADRRGLDRHGAGRMVRKTARRAGIGKAVTPHTLRHAFITAALDAGVPLRDVQEAASHADPRTTMRYDRARGRLDRHATYIVAAYVAGAAR